MILLRKLADFVEGNGKKLKNFTKGLIIQVANSPAFEAFQGKEKMDHVIATVKAEFHEAVQEFGAIAHDAVSTIAHATFAELKDLSPDWLDPLVEKVEESVDRLVDKLPHVENTHTPPANPPGLGELSRASSAQPHQPIRPRAPGNG